MDRARWTGCWESLIRSGPAGPLGSPARAVLEVASGFYGLAVCARNFGYDRGFLAVRRAAVPVISVGNLGVGGSGKTPVTLWCARKLAAKGRKPVILSRGYGRDSDEPVVIVSDGTKILADAKTAGDEPVLLAKKSRVPVVVAADRLSGAEAAKRFEPDCLLLDDGFQHRRLARDADLVCLDEWVLDAPGIFPRGVLREPAEGLRRARALVLKSDAPDFMERFKEVFGFDPALPVAAFRYRASKVVERPSGKTLSPDALKGRRVLAFSGIARPEGFERLLKDCGAEVAATRRFADHEPYSEEDLKELERESRERSAALVTTEKDAARLREDFPVSVLETEIDWVSGEKQLEEILLKAVRR